MENYKGNIFTVGLNEFSLTSLSSLADLFKYWEKVSPVTNDSVATPEEIEAVSSEANEEVVPEVPFHSEL